MTPNLAIVSIDTPSASRWWRHIRLWIPLFLLWIPFLLLAPFIVLALVVGCWLGRVNPWRAIRILWGLLCALPGTDVRVAAEGNRVLVRIL
ncbi:MAG TPA: hypothetical protein VMD92_08855 [Acidobacteriaceae bacterium]|nr:hypothetical protein [Acidobacteriaceae bacterium]